MGAVHSSRRHGSMNLPQIEAPKEASRTRRSASMIATSAATFRSFRKLSSRDGSQSDTSDDRRTKSQRKSLQEPDSTRTSATSSSEEHVGKTTEQGHQNVDESNSSKRESSFKLPPLSPAISLPNVSANDSLEAPKPDQKALIVKASVATSTTDLLVRSEDKSVSTTTIQTDIATQTSSLVAQNDFETGSLSSAIANTDTSVEESNPALQSVTETSSNKTEINSNDTEPAKQDGFINSTATVLVPITVPSDKYVCEDHDITAKSSAEHAQDDVPSSFAGEDVIYMPEESLETTKNAIEISQATLALASMVASLQDSSEQTTVPDNSDVSSASSVQEDKESVVNSSDSMPELIPGSNRSSLNFGRHRSDSATCSEVEEGAPRTESQCAQSEALESDSEIPRVVPDSPPKASAESTCVLPTNKTSVAASPSGESIITAIATIEGQSFKVKEPVAAVALSPEQRRSSSSYSWYWGSLSTPDAETQLCKADRIANGTYLVRRDESGHMVLSFLRDKKIFHHKILTTAEDHYYLEGEKDRFADLGLLVKCHKSEEGILKTKLAWHVSKPGQRKKSDICKQQ